MPACQSSFCASNFCAGIGQSDCSRSGLIMAQSNVRPMQELQDASRKIGAVIVCAASANLRDMWAPLAPTVNIVVEYCIASSLNGTHQHPPASPHHFRLVATTFMIKLRQLPVELCV
ncbi:uncharacterized protein LACBIDRAFT_307824 [Laccaria bicolor S238N-H82]|uniref:Predicted protein n=1 Tax=Laccaria bicolor (strain S238N-H82 / ATCC MYA-4686) TaxID=486041 RepID=B0DR51_LACBS|nr:uncharacterized protein LACBIDRAFT_307824 [Laccaria bicolor S238N-H82]EDR02937.1 predicted protein [Laccaria bicolor S238N-H82]|eukprot:XP_001886360.1 predicted protein [Laccaria bicolor S238N-H82]